MRLRSNQFLKATDHHASKKIRPETVKKDVERKGSERKGSERKGFERKGAVKVWRLIRGLS
jgi:hypothetical protein